MYFPDTNIEYVFSEPNTPSDTAILFVPGMSGGALTDKYAGLEKLATEENMALLRMQSWQNQEELNNKSLLEIQNEIHVAINFLKEKGYVNINAIGKSFGGMLLLYNQIEEFKKLVLWAPVVQISEKVLLNSLLDTPFSKISSLADVTVDAKYISKINSEVLILWGTDDQIISIDNLILLKNTLSSATLTKIQNMSHSPNNQEEAKNLFKLSIDFIKERSAI